MHRTPVPTQAGQNVLSEKDTGNRGPESLTDHPPGTARFHPPMPLRHGRQQGKPLRHPACPEHKTLAFPAPFLIPIRYITEETEDTRMVSFCFAILNTNYLEYNNSMDVGQALPRFAAGSRTPNAAPARRRDVGSPKSTGNSTHDLTGVFVKPTKEAMLFLCPQPPAAGKTDRNQTKQI